MPRKRVIFERLIEDLGAGVHYLRTEGFGKIILLGNSGGASTVALYQAEAEDPALTDTPAGDPVLTLAFTADTNVLPSDAAMWTEALGDRQDLHTIKGATHFLADQPHAQDEVAALIADWAEKI